MEKNQTADVHFVKTAKQFALEKCLLVFVCVVLVACFAGVALFVQNLPILALVACGFACLIAGGLAIKIVGEIKGVLAAGLDWKVTVSDKTLNWVSPVPEQMKSFSVSLADIAHVKQLTTRYKNSKRTPKIEYLIERTDGKTIKLDRQMSGIAPRKVFEELKRRGVLFELDTVVKGSKVMVKRKSGI